MKAWFGIWVVVALVVGCGGNGGNDAPKSANTPPLLTATTIVTAKDTGGTTQIQVNDPDTGQTHTFALTMAPTHGTATVTATGVVRYTPQTGFVGTDSVVVTVTDRGSPPLSETITIRIRVFVPVTAADLQHQLFRFMEGGAFAAELSGKAVELRFGHFEPGDTGPFILRALAVMDSTEQPAQAEGRLTIDACAFLIETSTFDAALFPELQPGHTFSFTVCELDPGTGGLLVENIETETRALSDPPKPLYNFVLILTDDQRWDTLWAMPIVQEKLVARGVTFTNAFVTTPLCCPARASLLSGGFYAHNTGILSNGPPNGGAQKFHDRETLATILQQVGYKTAFIGKYMNNYRRKTPYPYIPPGWTKFVTPVRFGSWFDFAVAEGQSRQKPTQGEISEPVTQYISDFERDQALEFLEQHGESLFFLYLNTHAPHSPATPAPEDEDLFSDYLYRDRAYGEADLSDKPAWVQDTPPFDPASRDRFHRDQLRSLQAVDRTIGAIIDKLEEKKKFEQTVFIFTSDNGYLWGEHGLISKGYPYEESIRVPLVIVMPGIAPRTDDHLVAINLDLGPTLFALADIDKETDGLNLVPLLKTPEGAWREEFVIEAFTLGANINPPPFVWAGLRFKHGAEEWKYIEYPSGETELYDLVTDPFEEESQHANPAYQTLREEFATRLAGLKGLAITVDAAPEGKVGQNYRFQLTAWGGKKPYTWAILEGQLPEGLSLNRASGLISGIPVTLEVQRISIQVKDSSIARQTGTPQSFIQEFSIIINQ
jgi:VCBS repeat-containing protein